MVHKNAKWDKRRSYRMIGNPFPEQRLVSFQIQEALPIENGKLLDGTVSPTFALCRAEGSPSQNKSHPGRKNRQWGSVRGVWRSKGKGWNRKIEYPKLKKPTWSPSGLLKA